MKEQIETLKKKSSFLSASLRLRLNMEISKLGEYKDLKLSDFLTTSFDESFVLDENSYSSNFNPNLPNTPALLPKRARHGKETILSINGTPLINLERVNNRPSTICVPLEDHGERFFLDLEDHNQVKTLDEEAKDKIQSYLAKLQNQISNFMELNFKSK